MPPRLAAPLLAVLLLGASWLALRATLPRSAHQAPPGCAVTGASSAAPSGERDGRGLSPPGSDGVSPEKPRTARNPARPASDRQTHGSAARNETSPDEGSATGADGLPPGFRDAFGLSRRPDGTGDQRDPEDPQTPEHELLQQVPEDAGEPMQASPVQGSPSSAKAGVASILSLPADDSGSRSEQLELTAREADVHTRLGFQLAGRGACYSARAELIMALRLAAQGLDSEHHTTAHSHALAAALVALKESEDFLLAASRVEADLDIPALVAGHRTPVLQGTQAEGLAPSAAMQSYLTFVQEQLRIAAGREVAGSMALYGLGKLHAVLAKQQPENVRAPGPKAVAFYQASLLVSPQNYMASNDLGVLLAQAGRYEDARVALERSVSVCRQPDNWSNLAKVYRRLGRADLARYAEQQSAALRQAEIARRTGRPPNAPGPVQWVDSNTFAQSYAANPGAQPAAPAATRDGTMAHSSENPIHARK